MIPKYTCLMSACAMCGGGECGGRALLRTPDCDILSARPGYCGTGRRARVVPADSSDESTARSDGDAGDDGDACRRMNGHNASAGGPKVAGSNPAAATTRKPGSRASGATHHVLTTTGAAPLPVAGACRLSREGAARQPRGQTPAGRPWRQPCQEPQGTLAFVGQRELWVCPKRDGLGHACRTS
jgi:hypothetical protein